MTLRSRRTSVSPRFLWLANLRGAAANQLPVQEGRPTPPPPARWQPRGQPLGVLLPSAGHAKPWVDGVRSARLGCGWRRLEWAGGGGVINMVTALTALCVSLPPEADAALLIYPSKSSWFKQAFIHIFCYFLKTQSTRICVKPLCRPLNMQFSK